MNCPRCSIIEPQGPNYQSLSLGLLDALQGLQDHKIKQISTTLKSPLGNNRARQRLVHS